MLVLTVNDSTLSLAISFSFHTNESGFGILYLFPQVQVFSGTLVVCYYCQVSARQDENLSRQLKLNSNTIA